MSNANGSNQAERSGIVCVLWRVVKLEVEDGHFSRPGLSPLGRRRAVVVVVVEGEAKEEGKKKWTQAAKEKQDDNLRL